jgi:hypothetical protein
MASQIHQLTTLEQARRSEKSAAPGRQAGVYRVVDLCQDNQLARLGSHVGKGECLCFTVTVSVRRNAKHIQMRNELSRVESHYIVLDDVFNLSHKQNLHFRTAVATSLAAAVDLSLGLVVAMVVATPRRLG